MAIVHGTVSLDLLSPENWYGGALEATATKFKFGSGGIVGEYTGYNFSYTDGKITGGTLTGYSVYFNGDRVYTIYDFSIDAAQAFQSIDGNNFVGILPEALKGDDIIIGASSANKLAGHNGNDRIFGNLGNDTIYGGGGDDFIDPASGKNVIDGGDGIDTLAHSADRASYQITRSDQVTTVTHYLGKAENNAVNVERFQFTDGTLAFDADGNAGKAFRLYQAAFDREPDASGLGYWIGVLDDGASLNSVASQFIGSDEFKGLYGHDLSNAQFVDKLYWNILDREGEEGGKSFWTSELDAGHRSRDQVLADFSESNENVVGVAPSINDGIWFV